MLVEAGIRHVHAHRKVSCKEKEREERGKQSREKTILKNEVGRKEGEGQWEGVERDNGRGTEGQWEGVERDNGRG